MAEAFETKTTEETGRLLHSTDPGGLSAEEARKRLEQYGPNRLQEPEQPGFFSRLLSQFMDPLIYVLAAAGVISVFLGEIGDACIIAAVAALNGAVGMIQEGKAKRALDALKKMTRLKAVVRRDQTDQEIDAAELVPGDLVVLDAGRQVPADLRLLWTESLRAEESALTGEAAPVHKDAGFSAAAGLPVGDRKNMAYMSSNVTAGRGLGMVTATGMDTEIGRIARLIREAPMEATPLQKRLGDLGGALSILAVALCAALFGLDHRGGVVGVGELRNAHSLFGQLQTVDRFGIHGHEVVHLVAAVDIQQLTGGAEAVRGVNVAAVLLVEIETPVALVVVPEGVQIVNIGALDVENVAEQPLFGHVERREFEEVVDAVFEHHTMPLGLFGGVHQLPALVERRGGGNLHGDVLALFHGIDGHRNVLLPRSDDVNKVDIVALAKLFPALLAAIERRPGKPAAHEDRLRAVHALGIKVAEGFDLDAVEVREAFHGPGAAHTQPDEAHTNRLHRRGFEPQYRFLARFARGRIEDDHAVDRLPAFRIAKSRT